MSHFPENDESDCCNRPKERRRSFLDIGGANSINKFASSYTRAQSYLGLSLVETSLDQEVEGDLSPCTSLYDAATESAIDDDHRDDQEGLDQINTFSFEHDENTSLLSRRASKADSERLITGDSTAPQTIFNCINTLMGIGMLSLPFGFRLSGWVIGTSMLLFSSLVTNISAKMMGRILRKYPHLMSYGDIAHLYGGQGINIIVTLVFTFDLLGAMISLIILFSDSFYILFPSLQKGLLKGIIVTVLFLLSFLPLSVLSLGSLLGIICTTLLIVVIIICGLLTTSSPGSLITPAFTNIWPSEYKYLLLSLGLFMAPWGGHPVFPELYRDMRHPSKFSKCCNIAFGITFNLDYLIAVIGFLMFGTDCQDSLTKNLMTNKNYPEWVRPLICLFMGLLPVSKLPLITRPIITVYESFFKLNQTNYTVVKNGIRQEVYGIKRVLSRAIFCVLLFLISLIFNSFGKVISFLGSAICFTICMTLPFIFYLKFYENDISIIERVLIKAGIIFGVIFSLIGTYGSIVIDI